MQNVCLQWAPKRCKDEDTESVQGAYQLLEETSIYRNILEFRAKINRYFKKNINQVHSEYKGNCHYCEPGGYSGRRGSSLRWALKEK